MLQWLGSAPEDLDPPVKIMQGRKIEVAGGGAALRLGGNLSPALVNAGRIVVELKSEQTVIRASWTISDNAGGCHDPKPRRAPIWINLDQIEDSYFPIARFRATSRWRL